MSHRPRRGFWLCLALLTLIGVTGCVERRMVIVTPPEQSGAIVYDEKNHPIGQAPVDRQFTYYGTYSFRLAKDGYKTLVVEENVKSPWYEWFGLDFISENLIPFTIRDVRYFRYTLQPIEIVPPEALLQQGELLRAYGMTKGVALPEPIVRPGAPAVLMPPAADTSPGVPANPNPSVTPIPPANNPGVVPMPNNPSAAPAP